MKGVDDATNARSRQAAFILLCYGRLMRAVILLTSALLLSGCLARTAASVVTLPVRAASAGVDAVTTSQSEADERRGREIREEEERLGRLARRCNRNPDREECAELRQYQQPE